MSSLRCLPVFGCVCWCVTVRGYVDWVSDDATGGGILTGEVYDGGGESLLRWGGLWSGVVAVGSVRSGVLTPGHGAGSGVSCGGFVWLWGRVLFVARLLWWF